MSTDFFGMFYECCFFRSAKCFECSLALQCRGFAGVRFTIEQLLKSKRARKFGPRAIFVRRHAPLQIGCIAHIISAIARLQNVDKMVQCDKCSTIYDTKKQNCDRDVIIFCGV